jgi:hypothetical protein
VRRGEGVTGVAVTVRALRATTKMLEAYMVKIEGVELKLDE